MKHLQAAGFSVETETVENLDEIKTQRKVPTSLRSCHTATVGGYIIEGHVPASAIQRLLRERPNIAGIAVPKMPAGAPGMESSEPVAYDVMAWRSSGETFVYATVSPGEKVQPKHN